MRRRPWTIADLIQLMVTATACLCLATVVLGVMIGVVQQKITPAILGSISGLGVGGGVLGIVWILYLILSRTLERSV
jgi:hypothetical protein